MDAASEKQSDDRMIVILQHCVYKNTAKQKWERVYS